jgi:hypothetical protein
LQGDGRLWRRSEGLVHPRPEITMDKEIEAQQSQKIRKTPGELLKLLHRKGSTPLVAVFFPVSVVSSL